MTIEATQLTHRQIVSQLTKSPHGDLASYLPIGRQAVAQDPGFFAHLVAWNAQKGQVRDAQVALPVLALAGQRFVDNALAHIARLRPREFYRAVTFGRDAELAGRQRQLRRLVARYLRDLEQQPTKSRHRTWLLHRQTIKGLYARWHVKPSAAVEEILFKRRYPEGSVFAAMREVPRMPPEAIARVIEAHRVPFLVLSGALGARMKDPDVLTAVIGQMSPLELTTNMKRLERLGVKASPTTRAALEQALARAVAQPARRGGTLKTSRAAKAVADPALKARMQEVQERQLDQLRIEGSWAVLVDASGSMEAGIALGKRIAAVLARCVVGPRVLLVFFNVSAWGIDVKGLSLEEIRKATDHVSAHGGTSIGAGLDLALQRLAPDGIVVVTDLMENSSPYYAEVYRRYVQRTGETPPTYVVHLPNAWHVLFGQEAQTLFGRRHDYPVDTFTIDPARMDDYAVPNLVSMLKPSRYQLDEEIVKTPLLTLDAVLTRTAGQAV